MKIQLTCEYYNKKKKILIAEYTWIECQRKTNTYYSCNFNGVTLHIPLNMACCSLYFETSSWKAFTSRKTNINLADSIFSKFSKKSSKIGFEYTCGQKPKKNPPLLVIPRTVRG